MFETGRRSAISTSELGLYSDRGDRYNRSKYGPIVRKFVIVVMAVVAVILAAIFIYDFASGASATSKVSQETKRIYILQNSLKKPTSGVSKRQPTSTTLGPEFYANKSGSAQDRSDDADPRELAYVLANGQVSEINKEPRSPRTVDGRPETRSQSLENFKHRKKLVEAVDKNDEIPGLEGKQLLNNHAVVYRVRQRFQYPDPEDEVNEEESRPAPFHFEFKGPQPASFNKQRLKFPQLSQYRYPHASRNIQDIIKYLTNDPNLPNRGIKFTGVYVNPKKYDVFPEAGELVANSDRNEYQADGGAQDEEEYEDTENDDFSESSRYATVGSNGDPFFLYKPKHPTDVNLLAPSNVRFSPSGTHRYNPYHDPFFQRPPLTYVKPMPEAPQYVDTAAAYSSGNYGKKKKPKPFSVMLDIYPITDLNDQPTNKVSRPRLPPVSIDEYDPRRPLVYTRGQRFPPANKGPAIPLVAIPAGQPGLSEEEERQQMIFHLNLYPRKKNKHSRHDIIQRSESMRPEDHEKFMHSVMSPFDAIAKHLTDHSAIEESKYEESELPETSDPPITENVPDWTEVGSEKSERLQSSTGSEKSPEASTPDVWHQEEPENSPELSTTEKETTPSINTDFPNESECKNCGSSPKTKNNKKWSSLSPEIDTPEGFQAFADGLLSSD